MRKCNFFFALSFSLAAVMLFDAGAVRADVTGSVLGTVRDNSQAVVHGCHGKAVETGADPPRCPSKQPLDAKAQDHKNGEERQALDSPMISQIGRDQAVGVLNLVG